jgi:hypothetical protein
MHASGHLSTILRLLTEVGLETNNEVALLVIARMAQENLRLAHNLRYAMYRFILKARYERSEMRQNTSSFLQPPGIVGSFCPRDQSQ